MDIQTVAKQKGLTKLGLKSIAAHFGITIPKDKAVTCSKWSSQALDRKQIEYATRDAYYPPVLHNKLQDLPDVAIAPSRCSNTRKRKRRSKKRVA